MWFRSRYWRNNSVPNWYFVPNMHSIIG